MQPNEDVTAPQLKELLGAPREFLLLDVREAHEREISVLADDLHIPLGEVQAHYQELDPERELIIYCRSGARSGKVAQFLRGVGFRNVRNVLGGINGWADQVDPQTEKY